MKSARCETIPSTGPSREEWIDIARGIGIVLVVYGHAQRAIYAWMPNIPTWYKYVDRTIYSFHMPLFFLLSGIFMWRSLEHGKRRFLVNKIKTIAYPYFLWSTVQGVIEIGLSEYVHTPISPFELVTIIYKPIEQFWFLHTLFVCQLIALLCYPHRKVLILLSIIGLFWTSNSYYGSFLFIALLYLPYITLGIFVLNWVRRLRSVKHSEIILFFISLVLFFTSKTYMITYFPVLSTVVTAILGISTVVFGSTIIRVNILKRVLAILGRGSMAIYLLHTIFSAGTRIVLQQVGFELTPLVTLLLTTLAGIIMPLCIWLIVRATKAESIMGFGGSTFARS